MSIDTSALDKLQTMEGGKYKYSYASVRANPHAGSGAGAGPPGDPYAALATPPPVPLRDSQQYVQQQPLSPRTSQQAQAGFQQQSPRSPQAAQLQQQQQQQLPPSPWSLQAQATVSATPPVPRRVSAGAVSVGSVPPSATAVFPPAAPAVKSAPNKAHLAVKGPHKARPKSVGLPLKASVYPLPPPPLSQQQTLPKVGSPRALPPPPVAADVVVKPRSKSFQHSAPIPPRPVAAAAPAPTSAVAAAPRSPPMMFMPPSQTWYGSLSGFGSASSSPAVKRKTPALGCTLLARPDSAAAEAERKHCFAEKRQLSPLTCAFCRRMRTTSQCFVCTECAMSVHKRCAALVTSPCAAATTKSSAVPVAFQASQTKHRGLRAINFTMEAITCQGYLYKQSQRGDWNSKRYFVLVEGDDMVFYFSSQPTSDLTAAVPVGGYPLSKAHVSVVHIPSESAIRPDYIVFSHQALEREILLAADNESDMETWVACLRSAIAQLEHEQESPLDNDWNMTPVQRSVFQETLLTAQNMMSDRRALFRGVACFDADVCHEQKLFLKIHGLFNCDSGGEAAQYFLVARLFYAGHNLCSPLQTTVERVPNYDKWACLLDSISAVPPEAVLMVSAYRVVEGKKGFFSSLLGRPSTSDGVTTCVGHVHLSMTQYGVLRSGMQPDLPLWPGEGSPIHYHFADLSRKNVPFVRISFADYPLPIVYESFLQPQIAAPRPSVFRQTSDDLLAPPDLPNPLLLQSVAQRVASWQQHNSLTSVSYLPLALSGANYLDPLERFEVARSCCGTVEIPLATLLHLVSGEFSCGHIRALAARALFGIGDSVFACAIPLLVCALRFEAFDCSALAECLIMRAKNDVRLTHSLLWSLVSQSDEALPFSARFRFLRQVVLARMNAADAALFTKEAQLAEALCLVSADPRRKTELAQLLQPFARFPESIRLPLSPQFVVEGVAVEKCRVLSSNAAPVMVRFVGVDKSPAVLIKSGDDLRQDEFALLFGDLLNRIWTQEQVGARVVTYRVISVMEKVGMVEMVENVKSVGSIQGGVAGALKKDVLRLYLAANYKGDWTDLMEEFVATLAGACVFEYVLGIGDRHGKKQV